MLSLFTRIIPMDQVTQFERKRHGLINILESLQEIWDLAEWFLMIVRSEYVTEWVLDVLIETVQQAIRRVKTEEEQEVLQTALRNLKKIKQAEQLTQAQDEDDLDRIMSEIEE